MVRNTLLSFVVALLLIPTGHATRQPDSTQLDSVLRAAVERRQVPAVIAMVATRKGVAYTAAVGLPADAILAMMSMTKPVTSVAVMQLVEAGQVQLDVPAATYLPAMRSVQVLEGGALRPAKSSPTVRQLLNHTSGFAYEFLNAEIAAHVKAGKLASVFTGTDAFLRAPLVADPGVRWEYGISTDWLGRLVETVSGQPLDAYFRSKIFEPLRMTETFFDVPGDKQGRMAPRYARQADGGLAALPREPVVPAKFLSGGGGLYSTADDYLRFARALLGGGELEGRRILKAGSVAMMAQNQIGEAALPPITTQSPQFIAADATLPGAPDAFGLGFALNRKPLGSGRGAGTMSWGGALNTFFWVDREKGVCAVVLTQMLPFGDSGATTLVDEFDRAVYRAYTKKPGTSAGGRLVH